MPCCKSRLLYVQCTLVCIRRSCSRWRSRERPGVVWCGVAEPVVGGAVESVVGVAVEDGEEIGADARVGAWMSGSRRARSVERPAVLAINFEIVCYGFSEYVVVSCWAWVTAEMGRLFEDCMGSNDDSLFC